MGSRWRPLYGPAGRQMGYHPVRRSRLPPVRHGPADGPTGTSRGQGQARIGARAGTFAVFVMTSGGISAASSVARYRYVPVTCVAVTAVIWCTEESGERAPPELGPSRRWADRPTGFAPANGRPRPSPSPGSVVSRP